MGEAYGPKQSFAASSFHIPVGHNRDSLVTTTGEPDLTILYNDDGSRRREDLSGGAGIRRAYYYDALGRTTGLTTISTVNGFNEIVTDVGSCQYDPLGRQVRACNYRGLGLGLDGENILRAGGWSIVSGPGLDDPLVGLVRGAVGRNIELFYVTDGQGRHLAAGEATGTVDAGLFNAGPTGEYAGWDATGAASVAQSYGANRLSTADAPGLAFYRNRIYDQDTGRWTQEDPLGVAGGLNLYQFNGNDPVTFTDPFGLCPPDDSDFGPLCPGYWSTTLTLVGTIAGGVSGGLGGLSAGAAVCSPGGPAALVCGAAGAAAGAMAGSARGAKIGLFVGSAVDIGVQAALHMANAGRGGGNQDENALARRVANESNLNRAGRDALHRQISKKGLSEAEIREIAEDLAKNFPKYLNNPPSAP